MRVRVAVLNATSWRGALIALTLFAAMFFGSALAYAQVFSYCGVVISTGTWCGNNSVRHTYDGQYVEIGGYPNYTSERLLFDNGSGVRYPGPTTSSGGAHWFCYTHAGGTGFLFQAEARHTSYNGASHTITALASYGTSGTTLC